jgi:hypothetical protein
VYELIARTSDEEGEKRVEDRGRFKRPINHELSAANLTSTRQLGRQQQEAPDLPLHLSERHLLSLEVDVLRRNNRRRRSPLRNGHDGEGGLYRFSRGCHGSTDDGLTDHAEITAEGGDEKRGEERTKAGLDEHYGVLPKRRRDGERGVPDAMGWRAIWKKRRRAGWRAGVGLGSDPVAEVSPLRSLKNTVSILSSS